jgi:hypothetical protein
VDLINRGKYNLPFTPWQSLLIRPPLSLHSPRHLLLSRPGNGAEGCEGITRPFKKLKKSVSIASTSISTRSHSSATLPLSENEAADANDQSDAEYESVHSSDSELEAEDEVDAQKQLGWFLYCITIVHFAIVFKSTVEITNRKQKKSGSQPLWFWSIYNPNPEIGPPIRTSAVAYLPPSQHPWYVLRLFTVRLRGYPP